jgi:hypothetical protein
MTIVSFRDWADPAKQALVRPGSILIDFKGDCYCFPVKEVHDDGVLAWYVDEWKHFSWDELIKGEIALYDQIDPADIRFCGPRLRERGGRFEDLGGVTPPARGFPPEDWEIAAALAEVMPTGLERAVIRADYPEGAPEPSSIMLEPAELPLTLRIRTAVAAHRKAVSKQQISAWNRLSFILWRTADDWRSCAEFDYY